jgi:hypothetical protein
MHWGDRFESHNYVPFYMDTAIWTLKQVYPYLNCHISDELNEQTNEPWTTNENNLSNQGNEVTGFWNTVRDRD